MNDHVVPDFARCKDVADVLQRMWLPDKLVRQNLLWSDRKTVGNFNLILVSICRRHKPVCHSKGDISWSELGKAYLKLFDEDSTNCFFSSFCESFKMQIFPIEYHYSGNCGNYY